MLHEFKSITQLQKAFPDEQSCIEYFRDLRWPDGVKCVHCGTSKIYNLSGGGFKCAACLKKFSVRNGTIFEDSKLPLATWFHAIFVLISNPKGVSSMEIHRQCGITQKSAWFVVQRIRELMIANTPKPILTGTVEVDEMYVGGKEKWKHNSKKTKGTQGYGSFKTKTGVLGMIERGGELRIEKIKSGKPATLKRHVRAHIADGAVIYTDEARSYRWMRDHYTHETVNHRLNEYVRDDVTTNRLEGAFGHFKRSVTGVYHKVSDAHINRYLSAFAWRWNRKHLNTGARTEALLKLCAGRRLTYARLIGMKG
ncbi:MAG: IS1595 family transposase [Burkholderiales bacterium]|nr:IS1595 family transposase [Burkholderiales bacterium]